MDESVRRKVQEIQKALEGEELRISKSDPVAKMMLVALAHQADEIERKMDSSIDRLANRFANEVLMNSPYSPQPAISLLKIGNGKEYTPYSIDEKVTFTLKTAKCNFRTLIPSLIVPGKVIGMYANGVLHFPYEQSIPRQMGDVLHNGEIWIAYEAASEIDTFNGVTFALNHPLSASNQIQASIGKVKYPISLVIDEDQNLLSDNFMLAEYWKQHLINHRLWLYRFGKSESDMPIVTSDIPGWLYDMFDHETLSRLSSKRYIWINISGIDTSSIPLDSHIELNCIPVANYDISSVKLSYTEPIKQLDNPKNGLQFLDIIPEPGMAEDFFVRDFDVNQYDNSRIAEDIVNLYRHYVDDYYAFVDSNSLNDGAVLRNLRMAMVQVSDSMSEVTKTQKTFNGTYIIRNPHNSNQPIAIGYITTQGGRGNLLKAGTQLSSSFAGCGDVIALTDAVGGRNKITGPIGKRELAKFIANSNDRLYTEIDIVQYCKVELLRAFGDDVMRYCEIQNVYEPTPIGQHIEKSLKVVLKFNSEKMYSLAKDINIREYFISNLRFRYSGLQRINVFITLV